MKNILLLIGSFVLSLVLFSFPVLATLSFMFDWNGLLKWVFTILTLGEFIATTYYFDYEFNE